MNLKMIIEVESKITFSWKDFVKSDEFAETLQNWFEKLDKSYEIVSGGISSVKFYDDNYKEMPLPDKIEITSGGHSEPTIRI